MAIDEQALQQVIDKEAIRELVLLYSRAIDRKDLALLRDLYTEDATDSHGDSFEGPADKYCDFIEASLLHLPYSGHHVCNHMISVEGDEGNGEVYALAYHVIPDQDGSVTGDTNGQVEDFVVVRYIDNYRRCADGKWRFSKRVVPYDLKIRRPFDGGGLLGLGEKDPSYQVCTQRLFQRGARG